MKKEAEWHGHCYEKKMQALILPTRFLEQKESY
jgi:hypothetical protein